MEFGDGWMRWLGVEEMKGFFQNCPHPFSLTVFYCCFGRRDEIQIATNNSKSKFQIRLCTVLKRDLQRVSEGPTLAPG